MYCKLFHLHLRTLYYLRRSKLFQIAQSGSGPQPALRACMKCELNIFLCTKKKLSVLLGRHMDEECLKSTT